MENWNDKLRELGAAMLPVVIGAVLWGYLATAVVYGALQA